MTALEAALLAAVVCDADARLTELRRRLSVTPDGRLTWTRAVQ